MTRLRFRYLLLIMLAHLLDRVLGILDGLTRAREPS